MVALVMFAGLMHVIYVRLAGILAMQTLTGLNIALVVGLVVYSLLTTKVTLV
jgi:hypothetical protein|tara:strand:- start:4099 stop:4254 length:156 start_codon:yes stop_codon:yes gene_type:complete